MQGSTLLRQGAITEIVGPLSSGRTSLLASCLRGVTRSGAVAALVDADGVFDPATAARAGVDLARLLWVRCGGCRRTALRAADVLVRCPGFAMVGLDVGESPPCLTLGAAFRLRLAVRRSGTALVVLARRRIAGGSAALAVETRRAALGWAGAGVAPTRLAGMGSRLHVLRKQGAPPVAPDRRWWAV
jgi:hypothetical protein